MKEIRDLKDLAVRACSGIYSNPEATAERNINDYSNDLKNLLSKIYCHKSLPNTMIG